MVWVVDKKVVKHLLERDGKLLEIPVRAKFEYEAKDGRLVEGTLTTSSLYNEKRIVQIFPNIDTRQLQADIEASVQREVRDHIALQ